MFLVRTQKAKGQPLCTVNLIVQNRGNPEKSLKPVCHAKFSGEIRILPGFTNVRIFYV